MNKLLEEVLYICVGITMYVYVVLFFMVGNEW